MTYYTIYQITNKINGKFYIGTHKTENLDDNYMGSGKYLRRSIEKNGIENFSKEILFVYDNPDEMYAKEAEIVNEEFLSEKNTYNLKLGGFGGWDRVNKTKTKEQQLKAAKAGGKAIGSRNWKSRIQKLNNDPLYKEKWLKNVREGVAKRGPTFKGKKHSEETKRIISEKAKERMQDPTKNSQYGTMWITNLETTQNRKIRKGDQIPEGWKPGRKIT